MLFLVNWVSLSTHQRSLGMYQKRWLGAMFVVLAVVVAVVPWTTPFVGDPEIRPNVQPWTAAFAVSSASSHLAAPLNIPRSQKGSIERRRRILIATSLPNASWSQILRRDTPLVEEDAKSLEKPLRTNLQHCVSRHIIPQQPDFLPIMHEKRKLERCLKNRKILFLANSHFTRVAEAIYLALGWKSTYKCISVVNNGDYVLKQMYTGCPFTPQHEMDRYFRRAAGQDALPRFTDVYVSRGVWDIMARDIHPKDATEEMYDTLVELESRWLTADENSTVWVYPLHDVRKPSWPVYVPCLTAFRVQMVRRAVISAVRRFWRQFPAKAHRIRLFDPFLYTKNVLGREYLKDGHHFHSPLYRVLAESLLQHSLRCEAPAEITHTSVRELSSSWLPAKSLGSAITDKELDEFESMSRGDIDWSGDVCGCYRDDGRGLFPFCHIHLPFSEASRRANLRHYLNFSFNGASALQTFELRLLLCKNDTDLRARFNRCLENIGVTNGFVTWDTPVGLTSRQATVSSRFRGFTDSDDVCSCKVATSSARCAAVMREWKAVEESCKKDSQHG